MVTSWFWLVGIVVLSLLPPLIKTLIGGNEDTVTAYLALFSIAVGLGSGLAAVIARGRIVLRTTIVGALLIAVFALDLGMATFGVSPALSPQAPERCVCVATSDSRRHRSRRSGDRWRSVHRAGFRGGAGLVGRRLSRAHGRRGQCAQCCFHDRRHRRGFALLQKFGVTVPMLFLGIGVATLAVALAIRWTMPAATNQVGD